MAPLLVVLVVLMAAARTAVGVDCVSHDQCPPGDYCDEYRNCFSCSSCYFFNDAITGPHTCDTRCPQGYTSTTWAPGPLENVTTHTFEETSFSTEQPFESPCSPSCECYPDGHVECYDTDHLHLLADSNATSLDLSLLDLTEIPASVYTMTRLRQLDLYYNNISFISPQIGQLTLLEFLDLSYNRLTDIPAAVFTLTHLDTLGLYTNQLRSIPSSIGSLTALKELDIGRNFLSVLPDQLFSLTRLSYLDMGHNVITQLPTSFGNLQNLTRVYIHNNALASLPDSIGQLKQTIVFNVYDNVLTSFPHTIGDMSSLEILDFERNFITSLPDSIESLSSLKVIFAQDNLLTTLPQSMHKMPSLVRLALDRNKLEVIDVGEMPYLMDIDFSWNKLTKWPNIHSKHLALVDLSFNSISEQLPMDLPRLHVLRATNNKLATFNVSLYNSDRVAYLDLSSNKLTACHGLTTTLLNLILNNNSLTALPSGMEALQELRFLSVRDNQITSLAPVSGVGLIGLDATHNKLTALPALNYSYLRSIAVADNAIAAVSPIYSFGNPLSTLVMGNNPSVCILGVSNTGDKSALCDCTNGFTGSSSCQSIRDILAFVPPSVVVAGKKYSIPIGPNFNSQVRCLRNINFDSDCEIDVDLDALLLNITFPMLKQSSAVVEQNNVAYSVRLVWPQTTRSFDIQVVEEAFWLDEHSSALQHVTGAVGRTVSFRAPTAIPNPNIPTNITFITAGSEALPTGIQLSDREGELFGTPQETARPRLVSVVASESITATSSVAAEVILDIIECYDDDVTHKGPCRHGKCVPDDDLYDGEFACSCKKGYVGDRCDGVLVEAKSTGIATVTKNGLTAFGVIVGVALLAALAFFAYKQYDRRKTFHVFLSYRSFANKALAQKVCWGLMSRFLSDGHRVRVFWDLARLPEGEDWEQQFKDSLRRSCVFVPLISRTALLSIYENHDKGKVDHFMTEIELALHYTQKKRMKIYPILVGDIEDGEYQRFTRRGMPRSLDTLEQLFQKQGVSLAGPVPSSEEYQALVQFIDDKAMHGVGNDSLQLSKNWHAPKDDVSFLFQEERRQEQSMVIDNAEPLAPVEPLVLTSRSEFSKTVMQWMYDVTTVFENNEKTGHADGSEHAMMGKLFSQLKEVRGHIEPLMRNEVEFRKRTTTEHRLLRAFGMSSSRGRPKRRFRLRGLISMLKPKKKRVHTAPSASPSRDGGHYHYSVGDLVENQIAAKHASDQVVVNLGTQQSTLEFEDPDDPAISLSWRETSTEL